MEWRVVNAAEYGAAQRRRRTFIFAYSNKTRYAKRLSKSMPEAIISTDGFFAKSFPVSEKIKSEDLVSCEFDFSGDDALDIQKISDEFAFTFKYAGLMRVGKRYTSDVEAK